VNQLAGRDRELPLKMARKLESRLRQADWNCFIHAASTWGEFTQGIRTALRERPHALVVVGGDGSVREAASRVARAKGLLGIIPCGLYNNIFHSLYGHTDILEAINLARSEYQVRIDAGLANGQFFLGSLITGLVPEMIGRLGNKALPRLAMTWSKLAARAADDTMPRTINMKVDSYSFKSQPLILNIHLLSHLMSLRFAPVAVPDDGRVVLVYDSEGVRDAVVHYIRDLKKDRYQYNGGIQILRGQDISITPATGRIWMIDGDAIEFSGEDIHVEVLHRILRIFSNAPEK
jgi:diacylglycerol kinase family enzyme